MFLRPEKNRTEWPTGVRLSSTGRPYQALEPVIEKVRCYRITVRVRGRSNNFACAEECNEILHLPEQNEREVDMNESNLLFVGMCL